MIRIIFYLNNVTKVCQYYIDVIPNYDYYENNNSDKINRLWHAHTCRHMCIYNNGQCAKFSPKIELMTKNLLVDEHVNMIFCFF